MPSHSLPQEVRSNAVSKTEKPQHPAAAGCAWRWGGDQRGVLRVPRRSLRWKATYETCGYHIPIQMEAPNPARSFEAERRIEDNLK